MENASEKTMDRFHRRNLPHWEQEDAVYFMTVRLYGSLPKEVLDRLKDARKLAELELEQEELNEEERREKLNSLRDLYFGKFDNLLDKGETGPHWLKAEKVAEVWKKALEYFDNTRYKVICATIMSNHVHFIFYKLTDTLSAVMHALKSYSGLEANRVLGRIGEPFWQEESFDRIIRNRAELAFRIQYVLNNPVEVGLVKHWRDWPWSYLRPGFEKFLEPWPGES